MLSRFGAVLLTCALFVVTNATAQPEGDPWAPGTRRITLEPQRAGPPPKVRISPGVGTILVFDTAVARVELQEHERFGRVRLDKDTLTLLPTSNLEAEELKLTVHFEDGAVPMSADFLLVVHATLAERQVEVFRHPRSAANLQAELEEKDAKMRRLEEQVARLQAAQAQPEGLTGLLVTGHMDGTRGVQVRALARDFVLHRRSALRATGVVTYRAARSFALSVKLEGIGGPEAWQAEGAALEARDGIALRVLRVWQSAPLQSGEKGQVVVETEAEDTTSPGPYTLTVWATGGKRPVILGNIQFP
ncbi:DUF2381 family protein [Pyxidicoccus sp. MSG2]|uniref:DUF2381 family protein n=1 Tax=Pyxidicoccus sp. MSG2 TaxID=2996790 RepID=UPI00226F81D2|nr:DUF2381 family protein [Pyxidicoccus sp. MSG2]MCY1016618.1 DUF2381 family protein [Pyxidicoccus sp. MSG2]